MNIEKAIEIGLDMLKRRQVSLSEDQKDTLSLLVEAGNRVKQARRDPISIFGRLLPGETEE